MKYSNLRQKDLDYLNFILRHGFVTAKQLENNFDDSKHAVYRRLRKLINSEVQYVKHHKIAHKVGVYYCTREARNITEAEVTIPDKISLFTMQHTLLMTDLVLYHQIKQKLRGGQFSYRTEREIRYKALQNTTPGKQMVDKINEIKDRFPDCIFNIDMQLGNVKKIWIELELSQKDGKRYDEKFSQKFVPALKNGDYDEVWYFTDTDRIVNAVTTAKNKLKVANQIKVYKIPDVIITEKWGDFKNGVTKGNSAGEDENGRGN